MNTHLLIAYGCVFICTAISIISIAGRARSLARWAFGAAFIGLGIESLLSAIAGNTGSPSDIARWQVNSFLALSFTLGPLTIFSLEYARGQTKRWRPKLRLALLALSLLIPATVFYFSDRLVAIVTMLDGGQPWTAVLGTAGQALQYVVLVTAIFVLVSLERTYRASVGTMRWRIKFMIIGLSALMFVRLYTSSQAILFHTATPNLNTLNSIGLLIACILVLRTLFRSGHFEIEVYPSQQVLQNSLTVFIVGAYLIAVAVFAKVATYLGGDTAFPVKALGVLVSLVLLGVLLQSDGFRLHLKKFISRHFKRPMYDYRTVWREFTEATSSSVQQSDLCQSIAERVSKLFDALSVSVWLFDNDSSRLLLASTTSKLTPTGTSIQFEPEDLADFLSLLESEKSLLNLEFRSEPWMEPIKELNQNQFSNGGDRILIPMAVRETIIGAIVLRDRVRGIPFADQDQDILMSIGSHAASSLLNAQLSAKVAESRELEAFQTMAAFFVHDLKNAASTLNIMVKNLPSHWDNPEFRDDALRGITKTGDRINDLIRKLSSVQNELKVDANPCEIDAFLSELISDWQAPNEIRLDLELGSRSRVSIDRAQMTNVVLNLLINASEAIDGAGSIKIKSAVNRASAKIHVTDDGCGMSGEFIRKSLFRPFKTTKQKGLGIGMFQSKMIVEAHGGKLDVESESGRGTTFTITLPLDAERS